MDIPKVTPSNGSTPIENTRYTLDCMITTSNPNPVMKYEWFQNGMKIVNESATLSFNPVKRDNSGSWICKGIINQSSIIIEKNSTAIQVNVFCKWFSAPKYDTPGNTFGQTLWWGTWVLSLMPFCSLVLSPIISISGNSC